MSLNQTYPSLDSKSAYANEQSFYTNWGYLPNLVNYPKPANKLTVFFRYVTYSKKRF